MGLVRAVDGQVLTKGPADQLAGKSTRPMVKMTHHVDAHRLVRPTVVHEVGLRVPSHPFPINRDTPIHGPSHNRGVHRAS